MSKGKLAHVVANYNVALAQQWKIWRRWRYRVGLGDKGKCYFEGMAVVVLVGQ